MQIRIFSVPVTCSKVQCFNFFPLWAEIETKDVLKNLKSTQVENHSLISGHSDILYVNTTTHTRARARRYAHSEIQCS